MKIWCSIPSQLNIVFTFILHVHVKYCIALYLNLNIETGRHYFYFKYFKCDINTFKLYINAESLVSESIARTN